MTGRGIDAFEVREDDTVIERINSAEARAIADIPAVPMTEAEAPDVTPERVALLQVVKPSFQEGLTWTFTDGSNRVGAYMKDQRYLAAIEAGQKTFGKGDMLKVRLRTRTFVSAETGLRTEHDVLEVIEEVPAPRQPRLLPELPPQ